MEGVPKWLPVVCNSMKALFHVPALRVLCHCPECIQLVRPLAAGQNVVRLRACADPYTLIASICSDDT